MSTLDEECKSDEADFSNLCGPICTSLEVTNTAHNCIGYRIADCKLKSSQYTEYPNYKLEGVPIGDDIWNVPYTFEYLSDAKKSCSSMEDCNGISGKKGGPYLLLSDHSSVGDVAYTAYVKKQNYSINSYNSVYSAPNDSNTIHSGGMSELKARQLCDDDEECSEYYCGNCDVECEAALSQIKLDCAINRDICNQSCDLAAALGGSGNLTTCKSDCDVLKSNCDFYVDYSIARCKATCEPLCILKKGNNNLTTESTYINKIYTKTEENKKTSKMFDSVCQSYCGKPFEKGGIPAASCVQQMNNVCAYDNNRSTEDCIDFCEVYPASSSCLVDPDPDPDPEPEPEPEPEIPGCMDSSALNYNQEANADDGTCEYIIEGCIDSNALNHNSEANQDNGTCEYEVLGCMDSSALNYNLDATTDDGTCQYPEPEPEPPLESSEEDQTGQAEPEN